MEKLKRKQLEDFQRKRQLITELSKRRDEIEDENHSINGMPRSGKVGDPVGNLSAALIDIDIQIEKAVRDYYAARGEIYEWLWANVSAEHQFIVSMRIIDRMAYREIERRVQRSDFWIRDNVLRYIDEMAKEMV